MEVGGDRVARRTGELPVSGKRKPPKTGGPNGGGSKAPPSKGPLVKV